jgi:hypothetical protein
LGFAAAWSLQVTIVLLDVVCGWWQELPVHLSLFVFTCINMRLQLRTLPQAEAADRASALARVRWEAYWRQWHGPTGAR